MYQNIADKIRNNRKEIDEVDAFSIDTDKIIRACMKVRSLFFPVHFPVEENEEELLREIHNA